MSGTICRGVADAKERCVVSRLKCFLFQTLVAKVLRLTTTANCGKCRYEFGYAQKILFFSVADAATTAIERAEGKK
jgi:hypothetical protein